MHDLYPGTRYEGRSCCIPDSLNIIAKDVDPIEMRMRIGMVFQKPNPFPKSIFENVAFGLRLRGLRVECAHRGEGRAGAPARGALGRGEGPAVESAYALSGGQQQRLCIARRWPTDPEILLFDEPTSALDPIATARIEELIAELRDQVTIIIVTHNMQQAARVSDYTAFMYLGELIEFDDTSKLFTNPTQQADRGIHHRPFRLSAPGRPWPRIPNRTRSSPTTARCRSCVSARTRWACWSRTR